ncbi:MAG: cytidylate kinase, partial [Gemmatimonadales bacterium]|nr:cytidylate kinase [Gemmatimonadales bacterium]
AAARSVRLFVLDGRDIGTAVFPNAPVKIFLTATPEARARRRLIQRGEGADPARVAAEAAILAERDRRDSTREVAPLRQADDAVRLDTTALSFEEQVGEIVRLVRTRLPRGV